MAIDYTYIVDGEAFGLVKVSSTKAVHLRMIVSLEKIDGQCVVLFADGNTLTSDLPFDDIYLRYNKRVLLTYQSQSGLKAEDKDLQL
jgi:hypothetical protein